MVETATLEIKKNQKMHYEHTAHEIARHGRTTEQVGMNVQYELERESL